MTTLPSDLQADAMPPSATNRMLTGGAIPGVLELIEETAYDLAVVAGDYIVGALSRPISVRYKDTPRGIMAPHDAVTNVDEEVEALLRRRLAARHPDHAVLGEEGGLGGAVGSRFTWVIDPVDGTTNFANGLPFFAAAIGVLLDGVPVAGATWCASTHVLRPGVYHARVGGELRFEGRVVMPRKVVGRQRRVSTAPAPYKLREPGWDHRHLGAIALGSALVSAGVLASARVNRPRTWDVAGGIVLAQAAGHEVWTRSGDRWEPFSSFDEPVSWTQPMVFGDEDAVTALRVGALAV